jgi:hypothetical protein
MLIALGDPAVPLMRRVLRQSEVRMRAAPAVLKLLCFDVSYAPNDPPEKRREAVKACRQRWEEILKSPRMKAKLAGVQSPD